MSSPLSDFCDWADRFRSTLPASAKVEIQALADQAYVDIEFSDGPLGRLSYWMSGSAHATVYNASGQLIDFSQDPAWSGPWDCVSPSAFDQTFAPFVKSFPTMDPIQ